MYFVGEKSFLRHVVLKKFLNLFEGYLPMFIDSSGSIFCKVVHQYKHVCYGEKIFLRHVVLKKF